ncbi:MAG: hypothetical protein LUQ49_06300, partial [Methanomicrobiales archaeon]|nr:hypothetical protein [Methanomicrobiales archaeon]
MVIDLMRNKKVKTVIIIGLLIFIALLFFMFFQNHQINSHEETADWEKVNELRHFAHIHADREYDKNLTITDQLYKATPERILELFDTDQGG